MFLPKRMVDCLLLMLGLSMTVPAGAVQEIRVGAAHFPPYIVHPERGVDRGLLPKLLTVLNQLQHDYYFVAVPSSQARRFRDFEQGRVDLVLFENPAWGWGSLCYNRVDLGLEDAEVFVAQQQVGRDQRYFSDLSHKRLALFSGYHYAFAGFNPSPKYLMEQFGATLTYSHESNLLMVARGRVDIALITRSNLSELLSLNPQLKMNVLVSERVDQLYHHYALVRPQSPISSDEFSGLIQRLHENGQLRAIFSPYKIALVPIKP